MGLLASYASPILLFLHSVSPSSMSIFSFLDLFSSCAFILSNASHVITKQKQQRVSTVCNLFVDTEIRPLQRTWNCSFLSMHIALDLIRVFLLDSGRAWQRRSPAFWPMLAFPRNEFWRTFKRLLRRFNRTLHWYNYRCGFLVCMIFSFWFLINKERQGQLYGANGGYYSKYNCAAHALVNPPPRRLINAPACVFPPNN